MVQVKKTSQKALGKLAAEMAAPHVTASALRAQHQIHESRHRKLELVDAFHGYACSWCGSRFPETALASDRRKNLTTMQKRRHFTLERKKQFAAHFCSR